MKKIRIRFNAPVILGFAAVSFAVMVLNILTAGRISTLFMTWHSSPLSPLTWLRFFTHVLGHAGWQHYISNMSLLLLIGPMLEEKYGSERILALIAITALFTGIANYILFPNTALCGASGVVFAMILLASFANIRSGEIPLTLILVAVIYLGREVYDGLFVADQVSNLSHIIGGLVGAGIGYRFNQK